MNLTFKYSYISEIKVAVNVLLHLSEYKDLRSYILPTPKSVFKFATRNKEAIKHTESVWSKYKADVDSAFKELGIKDPGSISCFLHGMSCEGWFDTDDNSIHVRFPESGGDKNLLDTIIHEILHLSTYDDKYDYEEREDIVDKILAKPQFQNILK